ncbi:MAG: radical SAM protein [Candidatus Heimdallarchaeaceae archaeon]
MFSASSKKVCKICGENVVLSETLAICKNCIKQQWDIAETFVKNAHERARRKYNLPLLPPTGEKNSCNLCFHNCALENNQVSYCGLRYARNSETYALVSTNNAKLEHYLDPLPCNCCAAWFCPAGTGDGFPQYSYRAGPEYGFYNLSVFFYGCSFDCLYCQNYHHKNIKLARDVSDTELLQTFKNNSRVSCICFFGGSPEPHFPYALSVGNKIYQYAKKHNRIARICFEWNGAGNTNLVRRAAELSLKSGGNIKFDLKAFNEHLHIALTGVSNKKTLENFATVANEFFNKRPDLPVLNATTLLVPGYIDEEEIEKIAEFIGNLNPSIPYSLLGFAPQFQMHDLPYTSRKFAERCKKIAEKYLERVNIGNLHILF